MCNPGTIREESKLPECLSPGFFFSPLLKHRPPSPHFLLASSVHFPHAHTFTSRTGFALPLFPGRSLLNPGQPPPWPPATVGTG